MSARAALTSLFLSVLAAGPAHPQDTKKLLGNPVAIATPTGQSTPKNAGVLADRLSKQQVESVQKVSLYFNQLGGLKGSFVQTNADAKRERGKFYIKRPGLFRFDYALPSKLVIVSDGKYIAIQDRDIGTDDRWDLEYTPFRMLLRRNVRSPCGMRASSTSARLRTQSQSTWLEKVQTTPAASPSFWQRHRTSTSRSGWSRIRKASTHGLS